jgi:hypothetical protein
METIKMSNAEFESLLEYSTTLPTGTTLGKKWRRHILAGPAQGEWWMGEYVPDPNGDPSMVGIKWRKIETPSVLEEEIARLVVRVKSDRARLSELGICPNDFESMPCMACGAGL